MPVMSSVPPGTVKIGTVVSPERVTVSSPVTERFRAIEEGTATGWVRVRAQSVAKTMLSLAATAASKVAGAQFVMVVVGVAPATSAETATADTTIPPPTVARRRAVIGERPRLIVPPGSDVNRCVQP
jgi:hypothetical protein